MRSLRLAAGGRFVSETGQLGGIVRFSAKLGAFALAAAFAVVPARASVIWNEINAGELPGTAEVTVGTGALSQIRGHLDFDLNTARWQIDLYQITILDPAAFSARTQLGATNLADPVLFLFGLDGRGIFMNDDTSAVDLQSTLPAGHPNGPLAAGLYYLAIAWAFSDPLSASGSIFPLIEQLLAPTGVYGPLGSGGADPLAAWVSGGPPNFDLNADYAILLTGAAPGRIAEPATLALLALGVMIGALRRRSTIR